MAYKLVALLPLIRYGSMICIKIYGDVVKYDLTSFYHSIINISYKHRIPDITEVLLDYVLMFSEN